MKIIDVAIQAAEKAGDFILKRSKKPFTIKEKLQKDPVTEIDIETEKLIIKEIKKHFPDHAILGEESDFVEERDYAELLEAEYIWIIDPIDGTKNFTRNLPHYAVSIGVFKKSASKQSKNYDYLDGEIVAGVIYAPRFKELYKAEKGKGAYCNGKKIHVSDKKKIRESMFITGFPRNQLYPNLPYFMTMMGKSNGIRRLGAATLDLVYVATGSFDGCWEFGLSPWDIAAGALIVEEAGGQVTDTNGNLLDLFGQDILATNGKIHKETVATFKKIK